jgi:hypothetical protein
MTCFSETRSRQADGFLLLFLLSYRGGYFTQPNTWNGAASNPRAEETVMHDIAIMNTAYNDSAYRRPVLIDDVKTDRCFPRPHMTILQLVRSSESRLESSKLHMLEFSA